MLTLSTVCASDNETVELAASDSDIVASSFSDLQTLIDRSNDEIDLTQDYTYSSSDSVISISKQITINGNGRTIDANGCSKVFEITGSNVILNNLTITNINIGDAKTNAISWSGANGQLNNCNISNNDITMFLGSILYWNGTDGNVDSCVFDNNKFTNTTAPVSFPVVWFGDNGVISNSIFTNNSGTDHAGAIYWGGGADNGLVYNCTFINNYAWYGGAIYWNGANGTVSKSYFRENSAKSDLNEFCGGAIYWYSQDDEGLITGCVFVDNTAKSGEAIAIGSNTFITIENSAFINNDISNANTVNATTSTASALANSNWWGNTVDDLTTTPNTYGNVTVDNWLFLNVTANPTEMYVGRSSNITFDLTHTSDSSGSISKVSSYELHDSDITVLDVSRGSVNATALSFEDGTATLLYTSGSEGDGYLTVNVLGLDFTFDFEILTSNVRILADDIYVGQNATVIASLPYDATGDVVVTFNNTNYTLKLTSGKASLTIPNLAVGTYSVSAYYGGDNLNPESNATASFNVLEKETVTINVEDKQVYEESDFNITITASGNADINVTVTLNNAEVVVEIINGTGTYTGSNLTVGNYTLTVNFEGNYRYEPANATSTITVVELPSYIIHISDLEKYYNGPERFYVNITDKYNTPLVNQTVYITINGVSYKKNTTSNGRTSIPVGLNSGTYTVVVKVEDSTANATVTVKSTVDGNDLTKVFRNASQYAASFVDSSGNILASTTVSFNINGIYYNRTTNANGVAHLNINLPQGTYILTAINPSTGEMHTNTVTVLPTIIENSNVLMYYKNGTQYLVKLVGSDGNVVGSGKVVTFNINGMYYNRTTNANGIARLNINLQPSEYIITAEYNGCRLSNNITVLPVLSADNLTMTYRDGSSFKATLVDGSGNLLASKIVTFNINGVLYSKTTNSNGVASLGINLMRGKYIITSSYNGSNIANTITIN